MPECIRLRRPLYHPGFPFVMFWSQKAGCTTVAKWFFAQVGLLEEALAYSPWIHDYEQKVFIRRPGYKREVLAALRAGTHVGVKVVRDPLIRAPSSFLVLGSRGVVVRHGQHWARDHWRRVEEWLAARGKDPADGISFLDHLAMVAEIERAGRHTVDQHLSPQHVAGEEELVRQVVPIEGFVEWTSRIAGEAGVRQLDTASLAHSGHHHSTHPAKTRALGPRPEETPVRKGAYRRGVFPSARAFVNARTIPLIAEVYRPDVEAYGGHYRTAHAALGEP